MQVSGFILSDWMHIDLCLWRLIHNGASWNRFMQLWLTKKFYDSTYPRLSWKLQGYPMSPKNEPLNPYQFYFNRSAQSTCCERSQAKWQAGRHSFKSNAELQAFKRRYEVGNSSNPISFCIPFFSTQRWNLRKRRRSVRPPRSAWKRRCGAAAPPSRRRPRPRPRHRALGGPRCERSPRRLQSTRFEAWGSASFLEKGQVYRVIVKFRYSTRRG